MEYLDDKYYKNHVWKKNKKPVHRRKAVSFDWGLSYKTILFFFFLFQPYSKCSSWRQDTLSFNPFMVFEAVLKWSNLKKSSVIAVPFSELRRRWGGGIKSCICNSFKIFSQFWLAKSTRTIHHNQLLMTKFGRRPGDEVELFWFWHFTRFKSKNYSWN